MHVGVLAAVRGYRPGGVGLVGVERLQGLPEVRLHEVEGLGDADPRLRDAGHRGVGMGEQDEGEAVAVVGGVQHFLAAVRPAQLPGVAARGGVAMHVAQEADAVAGRVAPLHVAEAARGHRVVEDEARAAHEVAGVPVVHLAVVLEPVEEAAARVERAAFVERHRVQDMPAQEVGRTEVDHVERRDRTRLVVIEQLEIRRC